MASIKITVLGLAAVKIDNGEKAIYVDAFFDKHTIDPFDFDDAGIILVTHDHGDHFGAKVTAEAAKRTNAIVVGPPSIAYPLLVEHRLPAENLRILYHQDPHTPVDASIGGVGIQSFSSPHFFDGDNMTIHNSYLIEFAGKRIFLTGDSRDISKKVARLAGVDALVYNFVVFDKDPARVSDLEEAIHFFAPRRLVPVHLVDCDWTIRPAALEREIERRGLAPVTLLKESGDCLRL